MDKTNTKAITKEQAKVVQKYFHEMVLAGALDIRRRIELSGEWEHTRAAVGALVQLSTIYVAVCKAVENGDWEAK